MFSYVPASVPHPTQTGVPYAGEPTIVSQPASTTVPHTVQTSMLHSLPSGTPYPAAMLNSSGLDSS